MGMHFSFESLITPVTATQVKASIYELLGFMGVDTTSWKPGAVVRSMISITSVCFGAASEWISGMAAGAVFETAQDEWADLHGHYVYNTDRTLEQFASGNVQITNSVATVYNYTVGQLVVRNGTTKATYHNTVAVSVTGFVAGLVVAVVADEAGADSTASVGEINEIAAGAAALTVDNANALVGSDEEETDPYKIRCMLRTGALSPNGPADAYGYVARSAVRTNGSAIGVNRVKVIADGLGRLSILVSTPSGALTGSTGDPASDLGIVHEDILQWATPHAVTPATSNASNASVTVQYTALIYSSVGLDLVQVAADVEVALAAYFGTIPIGGEPATVGSNRVYADSIRGVIRDVHADIFHVELDPEDDVVLGATQVPVLAATLSTITIMPRPVTV